MSKDDYQDLGLDTGPTTLSELSIEAQAQQAFDRLSYKVPLEVSERFIQMGMEACRKAAATAPEGRVDPEQLVNIFEEILRNLLLSRNSSNVINK